MVTGDQTTRADGPSDPEAQLKLFRRVRGWVRRTYGPVVDPSNVAASAVRRGQAGSPDGKRVWGVWRWARNLAIDARRRAAAAVRIRARRAASPSAPQPHELAATAEAVQRIEGIIATLPAHHREYWHLWFDEELTCREIADRLGMQEGAVKMALNRIKHRLQAEVAAALRAQDAEGRTHDS